MTATAGIIARTHKPAVVVLSAMSGVTNTLLATAHGNGSLEEVLEKHIATARELGVSDAVEKKLREIVDSASSESEIVACGELMSTCIMNALLQSRGIDSIWLKSTDFIVLDKNGNPDIDAIRKKTEEIFTSAGQHEVYVVQGFICSDAEGHVATLSRGGSDYTATLLGEALGASEVQIWTDVDGVYTADPRMVRGAHRIPAMSYAQANTAARCGAKILHPDCIVPAMRSGFAVRVLDSFHPEEAGTCISDIADADGFVAVAFDGENVNLIGDARCATSDELADVANVTPWDVRKSYGYISIRPKDNDPKTIMQTLHDKYIK